MPTRVKTESRTSLWLLVESQWDVRWMMGRICKRQNVAAMQQSPAGPSYAFVRNYHPHCQPKHPSYPIGSASSLLPQCHMYTPAPQARGASAQRRQWRQTYCVMLREKKMNKINQVQRQSRKKKKKQRGRCREVGAERGGGRRTKLLMYVTAVVVVVVLSSLMQASCQRSCPTYPR